MRKYDILAGDAVAKYLSNQYLSSKREESIYDSDNSILSNSIKDLLEWCVRTPHVFPFHRDEKYRKYKIALLKYQKALCECVSEVFSNLISEADGVEYFYLKVNPDAKIVLEGIKLWLKKKEESDEYLFSLLYQFDYNAYLLQSEKDKARVKKALNGLSAYLRKKLMKSGHKEKVHSFKRNSTECYKQVLQVCQQAWEAYSSILLIRLDWGYRVKVPDMRGIFTSAQDYEMRFKQVSEYRAKMLKALRKMYGNDLAFFVWKIECAPFKGLHIHWMIGLNGAKHQDRINVPKAIANKWDEIVGDPEAYTWNLSAEQKHEEAILRVIDYNDPLLWRIVGGYADYLTKVDYLVRLRTPKGMRSFGCTKLTQAIKPKKGPKRGKPMPALDPWAVRRPLNELSAEMGWQGYKS